MSETKLSPEIKEAWDILAEINDSIAEIDNWLNVVANNTINGIIDKWQGLCSATQNAKSQQFCEMCRKILNEIDSFQQELVDKARLFAETSKDRLEMVSELARDNEQTKNLQKEILDMWNHVQQPMIAMFFEKSRQMEESIHGMVEFAMEPAEKVQ